MVPKYIRNKGKRWTREDVRKLRELKGTTPTGIIGLKLGRPQAGVRAKASELGISLRPNNRSPYNRRKK